MHLSVPAVSAVICSAYTGLWTVLVLPTMPYQIDIVWKIFPENVILTYFLGMNLDIFWR